MPTVLSLVSLWGLSSSSSSLSLEATPTSTLNIEAWPGTMKLKIGCFNRYSVSEVSEAVPVLSSATSCITYTACNWLYYVQSRGQRLLTARMASVTTRYEAERSRFNSMCGVDPEGVVQNRMVWRHFQDTVHHSLSSVPETVRRNRQNWLEGSCEMWLSQNISLVTRRPVEESTMKRIH